MSGDHGFDAKLRQNPLPSCRTQAVAQGRIVQNFMRRASQSRSIAHLDQKSAHPVVNQFAGAWDIGGHDGTPEAMASMTTLGSPS